LWGGPDLAFSDIPINAAATQKVAGHHQRAFMIRILLSTLLLSVAASAGEVIAYTYLYGGQTKTVQVGETEGIKVNDLCLKETATCAALTALHGASRIREIHHVEDSNFSGAYCELLKGTQLFLRPASSGEEQFCVFPDLTMIDAKALYRRHSSGLRSK
jgi:hypothetical protein